MLLRLYPRAFRDLYAEGMAQTFSDLCREHENTRLGMFGLALRTFGETSMGIVIENTTHRSQLGSLMLRAALVALGLLMVPLVASRIVEGWNWSPGAFVFVYLLFFATAFAYALIARRMGAWSYKLGVGVALVTGFGLAWSTMVHVADSGHPMNFLYFSVLGVGLVGAVLSRLRARGLALTMFAMAATLALTALFLSSGAPPELAWRMAFGNGMGTTLLLISGLLFRHASLAGKLKPDRA